ncbi:hypothetical protein ABZS86_33805 [Streptomyces sp. NPDC005355]|uniref:hypothetical protein n=1 Tax=Streptomyces sp. NPDC005355 TaxID=3157038 RepID=UPI0033BCD393
MCVESGELPLTAPEATIIVVILVLAIVLALAGMPSLSVLVLLAESVDTGIRLIRRLWAAKRFPSGRG